MGGIVEGVSGFRKKMFEHTQLWLSRVSGVMSPPNQGP